MGVPERSFYEVLRFCKKHKKNDDRIFFSADRIFEKSENLEFSKNQKLNLLKVRIPAAARKQRDSPNFTKIS